jgi:hypothetical protein
MCFLNLVLPSISSLSACVCDAIDRQHDPKKRGDSRFYSVHILHVNDERRGAVRETRARK